MLWKDRIYLLEAVIPNLRWQAEIQPVALAKARSRSDFEM